MGMVPFKGGRSLMLPDFQHKLASQNFLTGRDYDTVKPTGASSAHSKQFLAGTF